MPDEYHTLRGVLIAAILPTIIAINVDSSNHALTEQTVEAIQNCMAQSPSPWPNEWKQEYIETIRKAVELHRDASDYALRLKILREGFTPCWESLTKNKDRALFEVYRCRMRWYVEHLLGTEFPSEDERQRLRDQFSEVWEYAEDSLLEQFPFLDPNTVQKAKHEDLNICYQKIETPLLPVYMQLMSEDQMAQIKLRWDKLRYARVDLWRRLSGEVTTPFKSDDEASPKNERDYKLTKESLSQLLGLVWIVVPERPDYYVTALNDQSKAIEKRMRSNLQARSDQQHLEKEYSRQLLQIEQISFLLGALWETPQCLEEHPSVITEWHSPLEHQEKPRREVMPMR